MNSYWNLNLIKYFKIFNFKKLILKDNAKSIFITLKNNNVFIILFNYFFFLKNVSRTYSWVSRRQRVLNNQKVFIAKKPIKIYKIFQKYSHLIKNNIFFFFFFNSSIKAIFNLFSKITEWFLNWKKISIYFLNIYKKAFGDGALYIRGLLIIFGLDALITDDEPLWEPLEWSLVQTWIFFIFIFAWIAENLITSRYGSFTGRDKKVWLGWYKTFWLIELWYALSYATAALFVIVPFYYELTYNVSFIFSWWNWYTRIFFFKFISLYSIILLLSHLFQLNIRWLNWKKLLLFVISINCFIGYLLYTNFIMSFFGYFTDPIWYQKTRFIDYIQLSHEPLKWGWGPAKRDHFTYHKVSTVFWFKNDGPFASAFLMIHLFFFLSIFFLYFYWLTLLRRIYTTKEVTYTFSTYCVSSLRHFFYLFYLFYLLIVASFITNYWRFPIEFLWILNYSPWFVNFSSITLDYVNFLLNIF
jgi:hypothetical protein